MTIECVQCNPAAPVGATMADAEKVVRRALAKARDDVSAAERGLAEVRAAQHSVEVVATQLPSFSTAVDRLVEQFGQDEPVPPLLRVNSGLEPA